MATAHRTGLPALLALALAACGPAAAPRPCGAGADCPPGARCTAGACVANAPPVAAIALPDAPEANALLSFDGSASADADPDDEVVSFAWTFRALDAPCPPPAVAGTLPVAAVRFACPGRFAVELTVTDRLGGSATAVRELEVVARAGPGLLAAGADVEVAHACTRVPARCAPVDPVSLSAAAAVESPDLSFEWTVEPPPDRPLGPGRRVAFAPDRFARAPSVSIETDGEAISGDWIFRVEARDAAGVVGAAATRVTVGNRPPLVEKTLPTFHHAFDGARFTVHAEVPFAIVDPDGDPVLVTSLATHQAGAGPGTLSAAFGDGGDRVVVSVAVPYAAPADALHLLGGDGLERAVVLEAVDANGARAVDVWPVVVANRPPVLVSAPPLAAVSHGYDAALDAYTARVDLSTWYDPDGDPLVQVPGSSTGDPSCPAFAIPDGSWHRRAVADCRHPAQGGTALAGFVGTRSVSQRVRDPWEEAPVASVVSFSVANRAPVIGYLGPHPVVGACADGVETCIWNGATHPVRQALAVRTSIARWTDPDGDPITFVVAPSAGAVPVPPLSCVPPDCALVLDVQPREICGAYAFDVPTSARDGVAAVDAVISVERTCDGP